MAETLLTVEQAAERLQLKPLTVRRQLQRGALRGIKRGRVWRVPESALVEPAGEYSSSEQYSFVTRNESGVPVVAGTRLKVAHLAALKNGRDLSPEELQEQFPSLSLAQVYGALAWYYEHQAEVDADIARREKQVAALEKAGRARQLSRREFEERARLRRTAARYDPQAFADALAAVPDAPPAEADGMPVSARADTSVQPEDVTSGEWAEWYRLTPAQRWARSAQLWAIYLELGGSLEPEPDTQSPFFDASARRAVAADGRPGLRVLRRSGV